MYVHVCMLTVLQLEGLRNFHCQEFSPRKINIVTYVHVPLTLTTDFLWTRSL